MFLPKRPCSFLRIYIRMFHLCNLAWMCSVSVAADTGVMQFYNAVLFMGSVAVFSLIAQRMNATR